MIEPDPFKTSLTFVVSYGDLWGWMIDLVNYLDRHNQVSI
jgi:hypothetical protein